MNAPSPGGYERVQFLDDAVEDIRRVAARSTAVAREVLRRLKRLDEGLESPNPLHDFGKTGDLSDCGKIVVALPGEPEHRIVVRAVEAGFEVSEIVAVEDRSGDLPYLLAGVRLGRITDPVRRSDAGRRIYRIRKLLEEN